MRLEDLIFVLCTLEERPAVEIANEMATIVESAAGVRRSPRDDLIHLLQQHVRGGQSDSRAEVLAKELRVLAENVELAMPGGNHLSAVASLLAGCLRIRPTTDEPKLLLWRLVEWAGLQLQSPSPAMIDTLYELAIADNPQSPDTLFNWLLNHTPDETRDQYARRSSTSSHT